MPHKPRRLPRFGGELDRPLRLVARQLKGHPFPDVKSSPVFRRMLIPFSMGAGKTSAFIEATRRMVAEAAERERLKEQKLALLMEHFGITGKDKTAWRLLAIRLAETFVRGFQDGTRAGAPERWGRAELAALRIQIDVLVAEGHSVTSACRVLFPVQNKEQRFPRCNSVGTMKRRYYQAKRQS